MKRSDDRILTTHTGSLPRTEAAIREIVSLPMHPALTEDEISAVAEAVGEAIASPVTA